MKPAPMSRRRFLPLLVLTPLAVAGCVGLGAGTPGSGVAKTEARAVGGLAEVRAVDVSTALQVRIETGGTPAVEVTADDNLLPMLSTEIAADGTLTVRFMGSAAPKTPAVVDVTLAGLDRLNVSAGGSATASEVQSDTLTVNVSGGGYASVGGFAKTLNLDVGSGAEFDGAALDAGTVTVSASAGGSATVRAMGEATVAASSGASVSVEKGPAAPDPTVTESSGGSVTVR